MPEIEINLDNGKNLWSNLLQEVKEKSSKTASLPISLLVLGNEGSGKSSLIARLQKLDTKHGVGLEFDYIEVKDEFTDENKKLNVWIGSGDTYHTNLLKYAINENNFGYSMCMVTVSFSEPWNLLDTLEEWLNILKMHINRLKLKPEDENFFKDSLIHQFQEYLDPDLSNEKLVVGKRRDTDYNYLHPTLVEDSERVLVPLEDGVFAKNLGIPIIVVITKTDNIFNLEQDYDFNDDKFDFIQMHLRKICLKYGAALCYTSLKDDRNCDMLLNYLLHRCYGFSMRYNASVIEKDAIFIPSGWDSNNKIDILSENLFNDIRSQNYNSLISKPLSIVRANAQNRLTEPEVAEDEQIFLMRQQALIQRIKSTGSTEGNIKDIPRTSALISSSSSTRRGKNSPGIAGSASVVGTGSQPNNEGVLANFFSSLLNKRGASTGSPLASQQASVVESPRGEDSISETDDYQKEDISNSLSSNTDATHQRMVEVKESLNQGKIVSPSNVNKLEITSKVVEDSDITITKFQNSLETLEEMNAHEMKSNLNNNTLDLKISSDNENDNNMIQQPLIGNLGVPQEDMYDRQIDETNITKGVETESSDEKECVEIVIEDNIMNKMNYKNDTQFEEIEDTDRVTSRPTEESQDFENIFKDENLQETSFEQKDNVTFVEKIENESSELLENVECVVKNEPNETLEEKEIKVIQSEETKMTEFIETNLMKSDETMFQYQQIGDIGVTKDQDVIITDETDNTKCFETESPTEKESVENVIEDYVISTINCKDDIHIEEDTEKVTSKPSDETLYFENIVKGETIRQVDDLHEIEYEKDDNTKIVDFKNEPNEEIISIENITENSSNEGLDVKELEPPRSEEVEIIHCNETNPVEIIENAAITLEDKFMKTVNKSEDMEDIPNVETKITNDACDPNLQINNDEDSLIQTDNTTPLIDNIELCDQTNENITLSK